MFGSPENDRRKCPNYVVGRSRARVADELIGREIVTDVRTAVGIWWHWCDRGKQKTSPGERGRSAPQDRRADRLRCVQGRQ